MSRRAKQLIALAHLRLGTDNRQQLTEEQKVLVRHLAEVFRMQLDADELPQEEQDRLNQLEKDLIDRINAEFGDAS